MTEEHIGGPINWTTVLVAALVAVPPTIASMASIFVALQTSVKVERTADKVSETATKVGRVEDRVEEVHRATNSLTDRLVESTKINALTVGQIKGHAQGVADEKQRAKAVNSIPTKQP